MEASQILFGKATSEELKKLSESDFLSVFEGVPQQTIPMSAIEGGAAIIEMLSEISGFLNSKGEARRALKENAISVNKDKVSENFVVTPEHLINEKYILLQRGKKNYFLVIVN